MIDMNARITTVRQCFPINATNISYDGEHGTRNIIEAL